MKRRDTSFRIAVLASGAGTNLLACASPQPDQVPLASNPEPVIP